MDVPISTLFLPIHTTAFIRSLETRVRECEHILGCGDIVIVANGLFNKMGGLRYGHFQVRGSSDVKGKRLCTSVGIDLILGCAT